MWEGNRNGRPTPRTSTVVLDVVDWNGAEGSAWGDGWRFKSEGKAQSLCYSQARPKRDVSRRRFLCAAAADWLRAPGRWLRCGPTVGVEQPLATPQALATLNRLAAATRRCKNPPLHHVNQRPPGTPFWVHKYTGCDAAIDRHLPVPPDLLWVDPQQPTQRLAQPPDVNYRSQAEKLNLTGLWGLTPRKRVAAATAP
ncbi:hypothetical protein MAPG_07801 [Magnaporthiopsis poae ATCC 64411]|uniref:Uncharacterized protein n=1 Tax=Magnaporthiopsis poae (strain ATCC 64411 / 73-15) TaxID=644358 RepID=A0A0C4E5M8_MAGP6|nr:hypothetical protein MAPG_07801 [Magnaporthiopsis poae ATCC 64411]